MEEREKVALFFAAQREDTAAPHPHSLGIGEILYPNEGHAFFFFLLRNFKTATAGVRQLGNWGWSFLKLLAGDLLSETKNATRERKERRKPGAECNSYGVRE